MNNEQDVKRAIDTLYGPDDLVREWDKSEIILFEIEKPLDFRPGAINYVGNPPRLERKRRRRWWQEIGYRWRLMLMALTGQIDHEE
ncbi:MAG: hypothetical protein K2W95_00905 [Candidatus Obscuribacterales bacterium]|nr:hypothetical protein [Candidatus Obscuribacterales bacterium]